MASLYEMAQGPKSDIFDSWQAGKDAAFGDKFNGFKLADLQRMEQARPLMGRALMGDKGSLASLAGLDPNAYMDVGRYQQTQAAAQAEMSDAEKDKIAGAFYAADTPEKWNATIDFLEKQGHKFDPEERDFRNRNAFIGMMQGVKGATQADQFNRGYGLDVMNAETSRINAQKAADAAMGMGRPPSGFRWTADGNLEPIKGGPQDPSVKASQGNGGVTTKMRNDAVAVDQAYNNLDSALSDYQNLIGQTGLSVLPGSESDAIQQSRTNLQLQLKELYNLGVLNGPDLSLMQNMIFDPQVSAGSPIDAIGKIYSAYKGKGKESIEGRANSSIARVRQMLKTIRDNKTKGILNENGSGFSSPYPGADGITGQDIGGGFNVGGVDIPSAAVEDLATDPSPEARAEFDAVFGQGASAQILGQ